MESLFSSVCYTLIDKVVVVVAIRNWQTSASSYLGIQETLTVLSPCSRRQLRRQHGSLRSPEVATKIVNNCHFKAIFSVAPLIIMFFYEFSEAIRPIVSIRQRSRWGKKNTFTSDIKALLAKYPTVDPAAMGCPQGWQ
jgi:hypothetical protein